MIEIFEPGRLREPWFANTMALAAKPPDSAAKGDARKI
jgi:hypothetical protein